jgi:hypothetical protein
MAVCASWTQSSTSLRNLFRSLSITDRATEWLLFGRLQGRGNDPSLHLLCNFGLAGAAHQPFTLDAWRHSLGPRAKLLRLVIEVFVKRVCLFDAVAVHDVAPFIRVRRERNCVLIAGKCHEPGGDARQSAERAIGSNQPSKYNAISFTRI